MDGQTKYVNYFIDNAVATLHEYMGLNLQLKTQLKVAEEIINEKQGEINHLSSKIEELTARNNDLIATSHYVHDTEEKLGAAQNKLAHMDTLMQQIIDMKKLMQEKDLLIESLQTPTNKKQTTKKKPEETYLAPEAVEDF